MVWTTPPPQSASDLLDQAVAKASRKRERRRLSPPAKVGPEGEKKEALAETLRRIAPLLLPWVFVRRFIGASRWVYADSLSRQRRDEEALRMLRSMPTEMQCWAKWKVEELRQLEVLEWDKEAIEKANAFLIERAFKRDPSESDRYLTCYAQWLAQRAFLRLTQDGPIPSLFMYDPNAITLNKVKRHLKRRYPLRVHPEWQDD